MKLGELIRKARKAKGLSQRKLQTEIGTSFVQICNYENGKAMPALDRMKKIAKFLDIEEREYMEFYNPTDDSEYQSVVEQLTEGYLDEDDKRTILIISKHILSNPKYRARRISNRANKDQVLS